MSTDSILCELVDKSDHALARWERWSPQICAQASVGDTITNCSITVSVTILVGPEEHSRPGIMVCHYEDGSVERFRVERRTLVRLRDRLGWVERSEITGTGSSRSSSASLAHLRKRGLAEQDGDLWRPSEAGRDHARLVRS